MAIKGDDIALYLNEVGYPYPKVIGCERSLSLTLGNEFYKVSDLTPDFFSLIPTFTTWGIESDTLYITGTDDINGSEQIMLWAKNKTELAFSMTIDGVEYLGNVFISAATVNANYNEVVSVAISIVGSGELFIN